MIEPLIIRPATASDAAAMLEIYAPFIESTAVSFETVVPGVEEFAARITRSLAGWQWLVAERAGRCAGYAYATSHRERAAYRWSTEVSAYIHPDHQRQGLGLALYRQLLPALAKRGYCNAYAGITLPNAASVGLHRRMGFEPIGTFKAVGWKFGSWHDVAWLQLPLRDSPPAETP